MSASVTACVLVALGQRRAVRLRSGQTTQPLYLYNTSLPPYGSTRTGQGCRVAAPLPRDGVAVDGRGLGMGIDWRAIDDSLIDPAWYQSADHHETFRLLRDEDPVHWVQARTYPRPFWAVTRHEHVKWCFENPGLLSNREGARLPRVPARTTATPGRRVLVL